MPESLRPHNAPRQQEQTVGEQQQFVETPEYQERRERTYRESQELIDRLLKQREGRDLPEGVKLSSIEHVNDIEDKKAALELYNFFGKHFGQDANEDEMQRLITIQKGFADFHVARDAGGKIVSCLQSFRMPLPNDKNEPEGHGLGIWYSATDAEYRGHDLASSLYIKALEDTLKRARGEGKSFEGFFGEADPNMEDYLNEKFGRKRMYYENAKKDIVEVPYLALPEDESGKGVRQNLQYRSFDGTTTISGNRMATINERIHERYTRPEFFTGEYAKFSEERYGMPAADAEQHHRNYLRVARGIDAQFRDQVSGQEVFFLSRPEREELRTHGRRFRENIEQ